MLEGIVRDSIVKQSTKQLRRDGYLIANIYGKGLGNINAAFKMNAYIKAAKTKDSIAFDVKVDGAVHRVVIQEYQVHPVTGNLVHVDLMVAQPGVRAQYFIPVELTGEAIGVKNKGLLFAQTKRVPVKCTIEDLPQNISLDITKLDIGNNILVRDLELPETVQCYLDPRVPVVGIIKAK